MTAPAKQGEPTSLPPIEGVVVNFAEIGVDFFVHFDLDSDGEGDVWVKILETILDMQGNELSQEDIQIGMRLKVLDYQESEAGFIEAFEVVVITDVADDNDEGGNGSESVVTLVNLYARIVGAPRPAIDLFGTDNDAWICLGEPIQLYWVTTPDVSLISLGEDLGAFRADQGGVVNGLHWGTVVATPRSTTSYQIFALDGTFESGSAATVQVFGETQPEGPFQILKEGTLNANIASSNSDRTGESDDWVAEMPQSRVSQSIRVTDIKPTGAAVSGPLPWRIKKEDIDGTTHNFAISGAELYQRPFTPEGTNETLPLSGTWTFTTRSDIISTKIEFKVKTICQ